MNLNSHSHSNGHNGGVYDGGDDINNNNGDRIRMHSENTDNTAAPNSTLTTNGTTQNKQNYDSSISVPDEETPLLPPPTLSSIASIASLSTIQSENSDNTPTNSTIITNGTTTNNANLFSPLSSSSSSLSTIQSENTDNIATTTSTITTNVTTNRKLNYDSTTIVPDEGTPLLPPPTSTLALSTTTAINTTFATTTNTTNTTNNNRIYSKQGISSNNSSNYNNNNNINNNDNARSMLGITSPSGSVNDINSTTAPPLPLPLPLPLPS